MGGHAAGEVASQIAVHEVSRVVARERRRHRALREGATTPQDRARRSWPCSSTRCRPPARRSTTAARPSPTSAAWAPPPRALLIAGDRGFIAHVGDSRIYLLRQARCTSSPRTTRSSTSWCAAARSSATRSTARPTRSTRTRSRAPSAPTRASRPTRSTSKCCPATSSSSAPTGCTPTSRTRDVPEILTADDIAEAPKTLVALANAGGGHDNITAVVVRVETEATTEHAARASDLANRVDVLQADAALQAPHVQGDHASPQRDSWSRTTRPARRSSPRADRRRGALHHPVGQGASCTRTTRSSRTSSAARTSARWRSSIARTRSASATAEEPSRALMLRRARLLRDHPQGAGAGDEALVELRAGAHRAPAQDHRRSLGRAPRGAGGGPLRRRALRDRRRSGSRAPRKTEKGIPKA